MTLIIMNGGADMFCRKCGTKLSEGDSFCLSCGTKVSETHSGNEVTGAGQGLQGQVPQQSVPNYGAQFYKPEGLPKQVVRFICANAVMFIVYFLGWLKINGDVGEAIDFLGYSHKNSISPSQFFSLFAKAKGSFLGSEIPPQANILYLLIVFPAAAALAIVFALLKKNGLAKLCTIIGGIVTLIVAAGAFLLTVTGEIGLKYGVFVAVIGAIYAFIAAGGLKLE